LSPHPGETMLEPVFLPPPAADSAARALWARVLDEVIDGPWGPLPMAPYDAPAPARPAPPTNAARALWTRVLHPRPVLGDRCVSVRNVPSARWTYVAPGVYEVAARKADGRLYWRCVETAPVGRFRSGAKAARAAAELAAALGVPVLTVRHGGLV